MSGSKRLPRDITGYFRGRIAEIARPETRAASEPLADWAKGRIRLEGKPFSFEGHEFLKDIYNDTSAHVVLCKAAQIGGTTWAILRSIHACACGLNVMYLFPTRTDVLDFSRSRVSPLLADNPFLKSLVKDTDTVGLKKIGSAYLYLRGMQSDVGLKSVPADMLVLDELDEATPEAKAMARERLSHSGYKRILELSNPSLPGYGIDEVFLLSDQRRWTIKCPACGTWTALDREFPARLGQEVRVILPRPDGTFYRACVKCSAALDIAQGEWVPDYPGRSIHGYRISQLFASTVDPGEILQEYRMTRFPDRFYNLKIGIPWADLERRVDVGTVLALCGPEPMLESSDARCLMGIDTGKDLHAVIVRPDANNDELFHVVHLAVCTRFEELDRLMERFSVDRCVIDGLPETHATRDFASRHQGLVFMNFFSETQRGAPKWDHEARTVLVNRTEALDASRAAVREKKLVLPRASPMVDLFARHMAADAKVLEEDADTGAKRYKYIKSGENHFSFAFTYAWLAAMRGESHRGLMQFMRDLRRMRGESAG